MQILLVRHGQTLWNVEKRWQGQLDSPLTELGKRQALAIGRELRRYLSNVDRVSIATSPLGRAMQTTKIIQAEIEQVVLCSLEITSLLSEHHLGVWQGLTIEEIQNKYPGCLEEREIRKWHYVVPGGESYELAAVRARDWLMSCNQEAMVVAVTHEMLSRTIQGAYLGLSPAETLKITHKHNIVYQLNDGCIKPIAIEPN